MSKAADSFKDSDQADLAEGLKDDLTAVKAQVEFCPANFYDAVQSCSIVDQHPLYAITSLHHLFLQLDKARKDSKDRVTKGIAVAAAAAAAVGISVLAFFPRRAGGMSASPLFPLLCLYLSLSLSLSLCPSVSVSVAAESE